VKGGSAACDEDVRKHGRAEVDGTLWESAESWMFRWVTTHFEDASENKPRYRLVFVHGIPEEDLGRSLAQPTRYNQRARAHRLGPARRGHTETHVFGTRTGIVGVSPRQTMCLASSLDLGLLLLGIHIHRFVFVGLVRAGDEDPANEATLGKDPLDQLIGEQACRDGLDRLPSEIAEGRWRGVVRCVVIQKAAEAAVQRAAGKSCGSREMVQRARVVDLITPSVRAMTHD
jgi:hypothetical protein